MNHDDTKDDAVPSCGDVVRPGAKVIVADFASHKTKNEWLGDNSPVARPNFWRTDLLQKRAIDGRVTLALHSRLWGEGTQAMGRVTYCQVTVKELGLTVTEFKHSAWRVFGRAGFECAKVDICEFAPGMVQVTIPAEHFNAHLATFIQQYEEVKASHANGAHFR